MFVQKWLGNGTMDWMKLSGIIVQLRLTINLLPKFHRQSRSGKLDNDRLVTD